MQRDADRPRQWRDQATQVEIGQTHEKGRADAEQAADKLGEDSSPRAVSLKQLELKCMNTIKRLMVPYQTERKDKPKGGGRRAAGCPDEGRKVGVSGGNEGRHAVRWPLGGRRGGDLRSC